MCRFTSNEIFTSGALEVNRHEFEDSRYTASENHANELANLLSSELAQQIGDQPIQPLPPIEPTVEMPMKPAAGKPL